MSLAMTDAWLVVLIAILLLAFWAACVGSEDGGGMRSDTMSFELHPVSVGLILVVAALVVIILLIVTGELPLLLGGVLLGGASVAPTDLRGR